MRQIEALRDTGIDDIVVVVGFQKEKIMTALSDTVRYRIYDDFASTNNLYTLWHVRDELNDDCIILFADVLFDSFLLKKLVAQPAAFCALVDTSRVLKGTMRITVASTMLTGIGSHITPHEGHGNFIGIAKVSAIDISEFMSTMEALVASGNHLNDYYTLVFDALAKNKAEITYVNVDDGRWTEVDTLEDFKKACNKFSDR